MSLGNPFTRLLNPHDWASLGGRVLLASIVVAVSVVVARVASAAVGRLRGRTHDAGPSLYVIQKLLTYVLILFGIFAGAQTLGVNLTSLAVFAGSVGVGLGLGLQGIVKDFIAGLLIIFDPQLRVGDFVEIDSDTKGEIIEVGPRATRLSTTDNISVLIPNSKLIENKVTNWTLHGSTRRIHIPFVTAAAPDKQQVRSVVTAAADHLAFTLKDDPYRKSEVWLTQFDKDTMHFELVVWPDASAVKRPDAMRAAYTWALEDALLCAGLLDDNQRHDTERRSREPAENDAARHIVESPSQD
ncbi:MAG: transporter [Caulobacteraceae bacterium]|nr:transporter [Caulobacteraceae bacterium]